MYYPTRLLRLLLLATTSFVFLLNAEENKVFNLNQGTLPADFPIKLVKGFYIDAKDLYDYETRPLEFQVKNISSKPVAVQAIIPGCSCITLVKQSEPFVIPAHSTYPFYANILGSRLLPGPYGRTLFIELQDKRIGVIHLSGHVVKKIAVSPSKVIDLGTYGGTASWTRTFTVKSLFPEGQLKLLAPQPDNLFTYQLTRVTPQEFQLSVSPLHLPIPKGRYRHTININTEGVPGYGPIRVFLNFTVNPHPFYITKKYYYLNIKTLDKTQEHTVSVAIKYGKPPQDTTGFSGFIRSARKTNKRRGFLPATVEEVKQFPPTEAQTWIAYAKRFSIKKSATFPDVTAKLVPQNNRLDILTTFPKDFFTKKPHGRINHQVMCDGKLFGTIAIRW